MHSLGRVPSLVLPSPVFKLPEPLLVAKKPSELQTGRLHVYGVIYSEWKCPLLRLTLHWRKPGVPHECQVKAGSRWRLQVSDWPSLQASSFSEE